MDRHGICTQHGLIPHKEIYTRPSGKQECRLCQRETMQRYRRKNGRRTYKQYITEKRGETMPLAATSPRRHKRHISALLTRRQVFAAWELYRAGMNTLQIAERGWQRWGYASAKVAARCLDDSFRLEGFPLRNRRDAVRLVRSRPCAHCGVSADELTRGCTACRDRHNKRRYRGDAKAALPAEARRAA